MQNRRTSDTIPKDPNAPVSSGEHVHEVQKGALIGGAIGTVVPLVGTLVGAASGAAIGGLVKKKHEKDGSHIHS
jgi:uncharacterized membrane protein